MESLQRQGWNLKLISYAEVATKNFNKNENSEWSGAGTREI